MSSRCLLIRADANASIGIGHVMRCMALAEAWQAGRVTFVSGKLPASLHGQLTSGGFSVAEVQATAGTEADAKFTIEAARSRAVEWVVVDGDHFEPDFLRSVQAAGFRVLLVDDFARRESFPADLILNPNLGAAEAPYRRCGARAALCLGESYVLLRREFASWRGQRVFLDEGHKILITFGGSDPDGLTAKIVKVLAEVPDCTVTAVVGPGYADGNELRQLASRQAEVLVNPTNMRKLMEEADLAIIAAGGTLWELLYMGCAVLSYAGNPLQARVITELASRGAVVDLGATADFDHQTLTNAVKKLGRSKLLRERMANIGRQTIDGKGTARVLEAMRELGGSG